MPCAWSPDERKWEETDPDEERESESGRDVTRASFLCHSSFHTTLRSLSQQASCHSRPGFHSNTGKAIDHMHTLFLFSPRCITVATACVCKSWNNGLELHVIRNHFQNTASKMHLWVLSISVSIVVKQFSWKIHSVVNTQVNTQNGGSDNWHRPSSVRCRKTCWGEVACKRTKATWRLLSL